MSGTGNGPSKKVDDRVLELVIEITGQGSSGIESVNGCDFGIARTYVLKQGCVSSIVQCNTTLLK